MFLWAWNSCDKWISDKITITDLYYRLNIIPSLFVHCLLIHFMGIFCKIGRTQSVFLILWPYPVYITLQSSLFLFRRLVPAKPHPYRQTVSLFMIRQVPNLLWIHITFHIHWNLVSDERNGGKHTGSSFENPKGLRPNITKKNKSYYVYFGIWKNYLNLGPGSSDRSLSLRVHPFRPSWTNSTDIATILQEKWYIKKRW